MQERLFGSPTDEGKQLGEEGRTVGQPSVALPGAGMYLAPAGTDDPQPIEKMQPFLVMSRSFSREQSWYGVLIEKVTFPPKPTTRDETVSDEVATRGCADPISCM